MRCVDSWVNCPNRPCWSLRSAFNAIQCGPLPDAFGVLIPRGQGIRSLGIVFESALFDGRAPKGHILPEVMLGGGIDPAIANLTDEALRDLVLQELQQVLGWRSGLAFGMCGAGKKRYHRGNSVIRSDEGSLRRRFVACPTSSSRVLVFGIGVEGGKRWISEQAERLATRRE